MPKSCLMCGCSCDAERVWQSICSTLEQHRAWRGPTGSGQHFCHQLTSGTAWLTDWVIEKTDTQPHRPSSPTPCVYTQPPGCAAAPLGCGYVAMVICLKSQLLRKSSQFIPWSQRLSCTHVDAGGVKRTLVGDAGVANGIWEAAVCQEAPPTVNDGPHHRHSESDGWSGCHQSCSQTDWEKWPCLRKEQKDKKSHQGICKEYQYKYKQSQYSRFNAAYKNTDTKKMTLVNMIMCKKIKIKYVHEGTCKRIISHQISHIRDSFLVIRGAHYEARLMG